MALEFREVQLSDLPEVFALTVRSGLNQERSQQDWLKSQQWLYQESQKLVSQACPLGHLAYSDGQLVGFVGYSVRRFRFLEEIYPAVVLNDLVVDPNFRGMTGILLCRHVIRYFGDQEPEWRILGLHHSQDAAMLWKALGSRDVPLSDRTFRGVTDPKALFQKRFPKLAAGIGWLNAVAGDGLLRSLLARKGMPYIAPGEQSLQSLDDEILFASEDQLGLENLLAQYREAYEIGVVRDRDYLDWRYRRHPGKESCWYGALGKNGQLEALAVSQSTDDGFAYLCEHITTPSYDQEQAEHSLRAALHACGRNGHGYVLSKVNLVSNQILFEKIGARCDVKGHNQFWVDVKNPAEGRAAYSYGDNKTI